MEKLTILPKSIRSAYGLDNQIVNYLGISFDEFEPIDLSLLDEILPSQFFYLVFSENVERIIDRRKSLQQLVYDRYDIKIEEEIHTVRKVFMYNNEFFMEGIGRVEGGEIKKTINMLCNQFYTTSFLLISENQMTTKQLHDNLFSHENHDIFSWRKILGERYISKNFSFIDVMHGSDGLTINYLSPIV